MRVNWWEDEYGTDWLNHRWEQCHKEKSGCELTSGWASFFVLIATQLNGSVKEPNKYHNYETEKITRKASDAVEYIELFGSSTRVRHAWHINVILWTSADVCIIVHDDLGWKNRTTRYNCRFSAASLALWVIFVRWKRPPIYASCMTISCGTTRCNRFWRAGCSQLEYIDIHLVY